MLDRVAPSQGRELKLAIEELLALSAPVAPSQGRELKLVPPVRHQGRCHRRPFTGA